MWVVVASGGEFFESDTEVGGALFAARSGRTSRREIWVNFRLVTAAVIPAVLCSGFW